MDSTTGLLAISSAQYSSLKTLSFEIGDTSYDLSPNAQIWPRSLNVAIGGSADSIYLVVGDLGSPSGSGLDFIDGYAFLCVSVRVLSGRGCLIRVSILASATTAFLILPTDVSALPPLLIPKQPPTEVSPPCDFPPCDFIRPVHDAVCPITCHRNSVVTHDRLDCTYASLSLRSL